jgi:general stress protein YciG
MAVKGKGVGRGWHGDSEGHAKAGKKGGDTTAERHGEDFYEEIGKRGGVKSTGKFKKGDKRAVEAGKAGGSKRRAPQ